MIGFFQNSMAKHHRLIFGVLLVFIVVSFVFYTGSGSVADLIGVRRAGTFMGVDMTSREETLPYRAALGRNATQMDLYQRIYLVKTAEAYRIPEPTQEQFNAYLAEMSIDPAEFMRQFDISENDFRTLIVHNWKIQQFLQTFGNVPSVFEADVEIMWKEMNTEWKIEVADISTESMNIDRGISETASQEKYEEYYNAHKENFRIAEKVKLAFAKVVPPSDVSSIPEPTEFELSAYVAEVLKGDTEKVSSELEKNRAKYVADWKKAQILYAAAADFSNKLYEKLPTDVVSPALPNFEEEIKKSEIVFTDIPAFPRNEVPKNVGIPEEVLSGAVTGLNETLWRTDAIPADGAVYVVIFRGTEPSRIPDLDEGDVRSKIAAAMEAEWTEKQKLDNALKIGKEWQDAITANKPAPTSCKISAPDAFTAMSVPEEFGNTDLIGILKNLTAGTVSPVIRKDATTFTFVRLISKSVPEIDKNSDEFKHIWQMFDRQTSWQTLQEQIGQDLLEKAHFNAGSEGEE